MGLDMYLKARRFISGFEFESEKQKKLFASICKAAGITAAKSSPMMDVEVNVAYWRKANAIHAWFVKNCQDGKDECKPHEVSREQLKELVAECQKVIDGKANAADTLPTQSGFFFGSTDYGDCYMEDMKTTVEQLNTVLANSAMEGCEFIYRSSW